MPEGQEALLGKLSRIGNSGSSRPRGKSPTGVKRLIWSVIRVIKKSDFVQPPLRLARETDSRCLHSSEWRGAWSVSLYRIWSITLGNSSLGRRGMFHGGIGEILRPAMLCVRMGTRVRGTNQDVGYSGHSGHSLGFQRGGNS